MIQKISNQLKIVRIVVFSQKAMKDRQQQSFNAAGGVGLLY
jgi:hypothetical protein